MEQPIYKIWNSFEKDRNVAGKWKKATQDGFTNQTIRAALRAHGGTGQVVAAIKNFHLIWHGNDYKWTYTWTLCQFLTRTNPHDRKSPQIRRFLPENFIADEWLKEHVKTRRVAQAKAEAARNRYELEMKSVPVKPDNWQKLKADKAKLLRN